MENFDPKYMKLAIELSRSGLGTTSPNPVVGCVIVKDGKVVGTGYHEYAGGDHAEIVALKQAGEKAKGADVYVTLEPCSFYGRTPPCTDALIKAGVKRVIVAVKDPHPKVSGKGLEILKRAGIETVEGVLREEAAEINRYYLTSIIKNRPYVTIKLATTLDGFIADENGDSKWITGSKARDDVQELRRVHDAVVVGATTFLKDRPLLTYRGKKPKKPELKRFVMVSSLQSLKKIQELSREITLVVPERLKDEAGENSLAVKEKDGKVSLRDFLTKLNELQIRSLLCEGGAKLASAFIEENLYDEIIIYQAPKMLGKGLPAFQFNTKRSIKNPIPLEFSTFEVIDNDIKVIYYHPEVVFKCLPE